MYLSEQLGLDYPQTTALEKAAKRYHEKFDSMGCNSYNGLYEYCLELKKRQDKGEVIPDIDYINVPNGRGICGSAWLGYFTVNFHYALFDPSTIIDRTEFEHQLNYFMDKFNLVDHSGCIGINIQNAINYYRQVPLTAGEVINILNITRPTLTAYLKKGLLKLVPNTSGAQYRYEASSVYALLDGKKKH